MELTNNYFFLNIEDCPLCLMCNIEAAKVRWFSVGMNAKVRWFSVGMNAKVRWFGVGVNVLFISLY